MNSLNNWLIITLACDFHNIIFYKIFCKFKTLPVLYIMHSKCIIHIHVSNIVDWNRCLHTIHKGSVCTVLKGDVSYYFAHEELLDSAMTGLVASSRFNLIWREALNFFKKPAFWDPDVMLLENFIQTLKDTRS